MGERKVVNKYYPPDFNPAKIPRRKANKQSKVRTMLAMNIRCNLCGNYIGKGTKFNSRKEEVVGKRYLDTIKIFRFYIKCSTCCREITVITDPQNSDYVVESGASEPWRAEEEERREDDDPMKSLESRARASKREMENAVALEELQFLNYTHAKLSFDALINNLAPQKDNLCEEDEALIKSKFSGLQKSLRRIDDCDTDGEEEILKKRKVSGEFTTCAAAGHIHGSSSKHKGSSATSSGKLILTHICAVKKKPQPKGDDNQAHNILHSLFKDYESDEEDSK